MELSLPYHSVSAESRTSSATCHDVVLSSRRWKAPLDSEKTPSSPDIDRPFSRLMSVSSTSRRKESRLYTRSTSRDEDHNELYRALMMAPENIPLKDTSGTTLRTFIEKKDELVEDEYFDLDENSADKMRTVDVS